MVTICIVMYIIYNVKYYSFNSENNFLIFRIFHILTIYEKLLEDQNSQVSTKCTQADQDEQKL